MSLVNANPGKLNSAYESDNGDARFSSEVGGHFVLIEARFPHLRCSGNRSKSEAKHSFGLTLMGQWNSQSPALRW